MIDKETHEFVKEIVLPNKAHVGSLAYDGENNNLLVCGSRNGGAQVNALDMESVEAYDFSGKQIVLFCTSGGSGLGDTEKRLKPLCDPTVQWFPGKRWNAGASEDELKAWVESLGCV